VAVCSEGGGNGETVRGLGADEVCSHMWRETSCCDQKILLEMP